MAIFLVKFPVLCLYSFCCLFSLPVLLWLFF